MANLKCTIIFFFFFVKYSTCRRNHDLYIKLEIINNLSKQMYGDVKENSSKHDVKFLDDLVYPRGDKHKLSLLSSLWRDYYWCTVKQLHSLTRHHSLPSAMVMAYAGAVARLPCSVCVAPRESGAVVWMYSKNITKLTFVQLQEHERMVREYDNLIIYNVMAEDGGIYRCEVGDTHMVVILEVVDTEDNYTKIRYSKKSQYPKGNYTMLSEKEMRLFEAFPGGVPCRSRYLPSSLTLLPAIQLRRNEIMLGMCKTPCKLDIFQTLSKLDNSLETANNTAGVYSLKQQLPKQPPVAVRDSVFADFGDRMVLRCPGTTLRDVPVVWRMGTQVISPREVHQASDGRVYLNSRDHLVFTRTLYKDADLYSCWQRDKLAGTVKLTVWSGTFCVRNHHILLLALVVTAAVLTGTVGRGWRGA